MISIFRQVSAKTLQYTTFYNKVTLVEQPKMRRRTITPIYPPPGLNLQVPEWTPEQFLLRIGKGCSEYADKFETIKEIFESDKFQMKQKGVPAKVRRYIYSIIEELRRGVLTFEYLERRTVLQKPKAAGKK